MDIEALMADPPRVHDHQGAPGGVWAPGEDLLGFLRDNVGPGDVTLETGCGVTTVMLADLGARHTSIFLDKTEGDVLRDWAERHRVDLANVTLIAGGSDVVLPSLALADLDLVLIDGCHGFPLPIIDWYYACSHLKDGGIVVVDDAHLAPVQRLIEFLDHDPRWELVSPASIKKWRSYRRLVGGPIVEEWTGQRFLPMVRASDVRRADRVRAPFRPLQRLMLGVRSRTRRELRRRAAARTRSH